MLRKNWLIYALFVASFAFVGQAQASLLPDARKVGEGTLSFAFWDIYSASLYAPEGKLSPSKPFVLSIRYMRQISAKDIVEQSVEQMRRQGFSNEQALSRWQQEMSAIFPDVDDGVVLSAVFIPGKETVFYKHDTPIGRIKDADFTYWFSNIWLGDNTSEPNLRSKLLGLS